ncbi:hypothetical protein Dvina_31925 [Dactylosporangium vinaceum]|uniref:Uncharacterized protein n=1 Tax=Dactylosporangium vinaceum TaxID=53362 RepID=A0ABV5MAQ4_9ACTN|nr:hypothetical protein [Dactylosporangium vinaceum]UAB92905.1 hypothetical protein Dvina_31925 [Dactylosporangium vinaceum]
MKALESLTAHVRQLRYPRALRILAVPPLGLELETLLRAGVSAGPPPPEAPHFDEQLLAGAATNLWRAQRRLARGDGARDRQTGRYLLTCREALAEAGLVVQDHDGDAYHPGRSLEVLAFQAEPGRSAEVVVETVRPTVYLLDRRIQMGQVIVAGPEQE